MITIKTHLDSGIYKSSGGGETRTHYEFSTGPRNLLKAIHALDGHRKHMVQCYGNIGCGQSWIEIDGVVIHRYDLEAVTSDDADLPKSCTQRARDLIAEVAAVQYSNKYNY